MGIVFTVKVDEVLAALIHYQMAHVIELDEAQDVWREQVDLALGKITSDLINEKKLDFSELNRLQHSPPVDNRALYNKYIAAFQATKEATTFQGLDIPPTIDMSVDEFDQFMNDNWNWRVLSKSANMLYSNGGD